MGVNFLAPQVDADWGYTYCEAVASPTLSAIKLCHVKVADLNKFANKLISEVLDRSWIAKLDPLSYRTYDQTSARTAKKLVEIFQSAASAGKIQSDFGELMVSMGSASALEKIFAHARVPLAELWKPQLSQNGGFDFHTTCPAELINFGEAKFSSSSNPYSAALSQAEEFVTRDQHFHDVPHLERLVHKNCIDRLAANEFGVVAAFSLRAKDPQNVLANAAKAAMALALAKKAKIIYLVGVE